VAFRSGDLRGAFVFRSFEGPEPSQRAFFTQFAMSSMQNEMMIIAIRPLTPFSFSPRCGDILDQRDYLTCASAFCNSALAWLTVL